MNSQLSHVLMRRLNTVRRIAVARGDAPQAVTEDMRAVLLAWHPALPLPMIADAIAEMEAGTQPYPPQHRVVRRFARRLGFRSAAGDDAPSSSLAGAQPP
jgi:hypothetical protein